MEDPAVRAAYTEEASKDDPPARPCVGCGYCCKKVPCPFGADRYGEGAPCGGLVFKDGRHWCGAILEAPSSVKVVRSDTLCIGAGCCSPMNTDRQPYLENQRGKKMSER